MIGPICPHVKALCASTDRPPAGPGPPLVPVSVGPSAICQPVCVPEPVTIHHNQLWLGFSGLRS